MTAYTTVAFLVASETKRAFPTMIIVMLVGLYDALVGWEIAEKLKANYGYSEELIQNITTAHRIFIGYRYAMVSGIPGYYLARR